MGIITLVVLGLTLVGILFGVLFGLIRGRDRALLRLGLIILSVILALVLRGTVVDTVMNLEIDGATIQETLLEEFQSEDMSIPKNLQNLIFTLIEIIGGFVVYFVLLFALRFVTWLFLFPFLKLIIRHFENKRVRKVLAEDDPESDERIRFTRKQRKQIVKKHRGIGALVGLVQGILVAYFLFAPLTCLTTQVTKITNLKIDGEVLLEIPEDIGLTEYTESVPGKIYSATGHWFYSMMTTATDADGKEVSLEKLLDSAVVIVQIADTAITVEDEISVLEDENATPEQVIDAVNSLGDKIITIGNSMEEIDEDTLNMITDIIVDVAGEEAPVEEIEKFTEVLTPEILVQTGNGIKSLATYEQIKMDGTDVTAEQANQIVKGVSDCLSVMDVIGEVAGEDVTEDLELDIDDKDKETFKTAIEGLSDLSAEEKDTLFGVFGIE